MIDKLKLDWEDYYLLEEILKRHPEWLEYTENDPDVKTSFIIIVPCPTEGNPPICIDNFGAGPNVFYGPACFDGYRLGRISTTISSHWLDKFNIHCVDAIDVVVNEITSEELIAAHWKGLVGKSGYLDPEGYKDLLENDKIITSVSWLGTYNHNYNGEWSNPFPDAPIT